MLNLETIGSKIALKRKEQNMTQNELAESLFVTHQAVSKWENGKSIPTIDILYELTKLLHVSIDYLLDDSEIKDDDYELLLRSYPRMAIISKFLQTENLDYEIDKLFYLLTKEERQFIIDQLISSHVDLLVESIWHLLSKKERTYLLSVIITGKFDYDLNQISDSLSTPERILIHRAYREGSYSYLVNYKGVIL